MLLVPDFEHPAKTMVCTPQRPTKRWNLKMRGNGFIKRERRKELLQT